MDLDKATWISSDQHLKQDMFSRLNLIINALNAIGLTKLGDVEVVRKIIYVYT